MLHSFYRYGKQGKQEKWVVFRKSQGKPGKIRGMLYEIFFCQGKVREIFVTDCRTDWWTHACDLIFHIYILIFAITIPQRQVNGSVTSLAFKSLLSDPKINPFLANVLILYSPETPKTKRFLVFSGSIKWKHWLEIN